MSNNTDNTLEIKKNKRPSRTHSAAFAVKSRILKGKRIAADFLRPAAEHHSKRANLSNKPVLCESTSLLWNMADDREYLLTAGKIQNLRKAVRDLDGIVIEPNKLFSFWKQIGRASRLKGYVKGREIREGCLIPTIGGGLCQLSNALYDCALKAGFEIVERHSHSHIVPGSLSESGRDATVFWNYIDLRFRHDRPFRIEATLTPEKLVVRFRGDVTPKGRGALPIAAARNIVSGSCDTCGVDVCFREAHRVIESKRTAFLLDEYSPEFDSFIASIRTEADTLFIPINGKLFRKRNYAWTLEGFGKVRRSPVLTLERSIRSRRLSSKGAARQKNLLAMSLKLAVSYANRLDYRISDLVVQQNLLPHLHRLGVLGGRSYMVLMNALPMHEIQRRLNIASSLHPQSTTLSDFRASPRLIDEEMSALANAQKIITPHTDIAAMFPNKNLLIDWKLPPTSIQRTEREKIPLIVFPASTVGRKGAYELREALRGLDVLLMPMGPVIESSGFWDGFRIVAPDNEWPTRADIVVLPAFVEHNPRRILAASRNGIPVIATAACGVTGLPKIAIVDSGSSSQLKDAILMHLDSIRSVNLNTELFSESLSC